MSWKEALEKAVGVLEECATARDMAGLFERAGIRGRRGSAKSCPAAVWLTKQSQAAGGPPVQVGIWMIHAGPELDKNRAEWRKQMPVVLRQFIAKFDGGAYPLLGAQRLAHWPQEGNY